MSRRSRGNNIPKLVTLGAGVAVCVGGLGFAAMQASGARTADEYGCYEELKQPETIVVLDASEPRWNEEQARSLRRSFDQLYQKLAFNERLSVYTSEGDMVGSVAAPRFHICGQASSPEQLEAINAQSGQTGYLQKQRERLYEKVLAPQLDALLSANPDEQRRQLYQSPVLELVADLSRSTLKPGSRLILVSDLIQNSDSVRFCRTHNDMPPFAAFKKRRVYQRLKPQSLEGVEVEVLMLQRHGYGQGAFLHCRSEEELRDFWQDYLTDNGVVNPQFVRIRHGVVGA